MSVTKAGFVYDMDDETYHRDAVPGGSLSSTFARLLTEHVPAKAKARTRREASTSMNLGKAVHAQVLGTGPRLIVWEHDGRTKAGKAERAQYADAIAAEGAVAVTAAESHTITEMVRALKAHDEVRAILESSRAEVSAFWQEGGIWCRARYDLLSDVRVYDYKTTSDCSADGFAYAMANFGYHQQDDFYRRGLRALGHPAHLHPMRFICQETEAPYLVQIHESDELAQEIAGALNDRAIHIYRECMRLGDWPGYDSLFASPTELPNNYFYRHGNKIPANLNPFSEEAA